MTIYLDKNLIINVVDKHSSSIDNKEACSIKGREASSQDILDFQDILCLDEIEHDKECLLEYDINNKHVNVEHRVSPESIFSVEKIVADTSSIKSPELQSLISEISIYLSKSNNLSNTVSITLNNLDGVKNINLNQDKSGTINISFLVDKNINIVDFIEKINALKVSLQGKINNNLSLFIRSDKISKDVDTLANFVDLRSNLDENIKSLTSQLRIDDNLNLDLQSSLSKNTENLDLNKLSENINFSDLQSSLDFNLEKLPSLEDFVKKLRNDNSCISDVNIIKGHVSEEDIKLFGTNNNLNDQANKNLHKKRDNANDQSRNRQDCNNMDEDL